MLTRSKQIDIKGRIPILVLEASEIRTMMAESKSDYVQLDVENIISDSSYTKKPKHNVSEVNLLDGEDDIYSQLSKYWLPRNLILDQDSVEKRRISQYDLDEEDESYLEQSQLGMDREQFEELMEGFELTLPATFPLPIPETWHRIEPRAENVLSVFHHWNRKRGNGSMMLPRLLDQSDHLGKKNPYVCFTTRVHHRRSSSQTMAMDGGGGGEKLLYEYDGFEFYEKKSCDGEDAYCITDDEEVLLKSTLITRKKRGGQT